jgi:FkbM family methyltransferase
MKAIDPKAWGNPRGLDDLLANDRFALFGATRGAVLPEEILQRSGKNIACYFDNDKAKQGTVFRGAPVLPPDEAIAFASKGGTIIIASAYHREISAQLMGQFGIPLDRIFPYIGTIFEHHFGRANVEALLPHSARLMQRYADAPSQQYFADLLRYRWTMDPRLLPANPRGGLRYTYDGIGFGPHKGDVIVDCGAFDGDTAKLFVEATGGDCTILAIEPMAGSYQKLVDWIAADKVAHAVKPIKCGIGDAPGEAELTYDVDGHEDGSSFGKHLHGDRTESVPIETIDRLCADYPHVDLIKMDIEGFEAGALKGGAETIARHKPDLAVSAYHRRNDPVDLADLIDSITPGYEIYAGHHPHATYEIEYYCIHKDRRRS